MGKFDGSEDLPVIGLAVKFLSGDEEEAKAWAREHAMKGWYIQRGPQMCTLSFNHKEGDTATFPFTYVWDGEKIVKQYHEELKGEV